MFNNDQCRHHNISPHRKDFPWQHIWREDSCNLKMLTLVVNSWHCCWLSVHRNSVDGGGAGTSIVICFHVMPRPLMLLSLLQSGPVFFYIFLHYIFYRYFVVALVSMQHSYNITSCNVFLQNCSEAVQWLNHLKGSVKEPSKFHNYETEKITRKASDVAEYIELFGSSPEIVMYDAFNVILWTSADICIVVHDDLGWKNWITI